MSNPAAASGSIDETPENSEPTYGGFAIKEVLQAGYAKHPELGYIRAFLIRFKETVRLTEKVDCPGKFAKKFGAFHAPGEPCPHQWGDSTDVWVSKYDYRKKKDVNPPAKPCRFCSNWYSRIDAVVRHEKEVCKYPGAPKHDCKSRGCDVKECPGRMKPYRSPSFSYD